jgi:hypothetical protein
LFFEAVIELVYLYLKLLTVYRLIQLDSSTHSSSMADADGTKPVEAVINPPATSENVVITNESKPAVELPEKLEPPVADTEPVNPEHIAVDPTIPTTVPVEGPLSNGLAWPELSDDHVLSKFLIKLPEILTATSHNEVYGVTLKATSAGSTPDFHTLLILQKFLRANQNDLPKAEEQLTKTLKWRKEFDPTKAAIEVFKKDKFNGLGYITVVPAKDKQSSQVVTTWNIYGAVKDYEKTFVPVEE